jgi:hypothetical protein
MPTALLKAALIGGIGGPFVGRALALLFRENAIESFPPGSLPLHEWVGFAAPVGMLYSLLFYSVFSILVPVVSSGYEARKRGHAKVGTSD